MSAPLLFQQIQPHQSLLNHTPATTMEFIAKLIGSNPDIKVVETIQSTYPGALSNQELCKKLQAALSKHGYGKTTLLATSLCCDEVNRALEKELAKMFGDNFTMGGLAGFPFCGATSFMAMAHHIPHDGSCLIVYGPHVGIDSEGTVGKVDRRGRELSGACCGSATDAAAYVKQVSAGEIEKAGIPKCPFDAQQIWVRNSLLPHSERLAAAEVEAAEVPLALFDCQDEMMKRIVDEMCGEVAEGGKIVLLGGIQINTPSGTSDYFLPKVFEIKCNQGKTVEDLIGTLV